MSIQIWIRNSLVTFLVVLIGNHLDYGGAVWGQIRPEQPAVTQQNSTNKIRVKPTELASKAGSAVDWCEDFEKALQKSKSSGKPVFWYVPTIHGTFMDRKQEIDRYMMAGFFSWPQIIDELNDKFVPLKTPPPSQRQEQYELIRYKFIEPGFVILAPDGSARAKVDRITTQHPAWLLNYLRQLNQPNMDDATVFPSITGLSKQDLQTSTDVVQQKMLQAMLQFRSGDHDAANAAWNRLADEHSNHPLAWKAAAEAQGIGPFGRGFEVLTDLPDRAFLAGSQSAGSLAPLGTFTQGEIWQRCVNFLLGMQRSDGGFCDSDYDFGGTDSLPNVHVAVTALVGMALLDAREMVDTANTAAIDKAVARCLDFVTDETNLNRVDRDEILWADAYRVRFIVRCRHGRKDDALAAKLQAAVKALENLQSRRGTWYHEYANAFVTATALIALHDAREAGATVDAAKVEAGCSALNNLRSQDGSYPYYARPNPEGRAGNVPAAAGRMPLCELALHVWDKSDQSRLAYALEKSFEFHRHLDSARKYDNHTSTYAYGGFFFWYDMRSRTEAVAAIGDQELRSRMMKQQLDLIMQLPELDGCFVDSHELGRCYGSAMAMLCLKQIHDELKD